MKRTRTVRTYLRAKAREYGRDAATCAAWALNYSQQAEYWRHHGNDALAAHLQNGADQSAALAYDFACRAAHAARCTVTR